MNDSHTSRPGCTVSSLPWEALCGAFVHCNVCLRLQYSGAADYTDCSVRDLRSFYPRAINDFTA